ncbi:hypothetical protein Tco_0870362 [Tanacetum coccineum]
MMGIPRTIMVGGKPFKTEHQLNEFKHIEPVKQKKRGLAPERNEVIRNKVEKLTKANILREVKYHTWVSNPVMELHIKNWLTRCSTIGSGTTLKKCTNGKIVQWTTEADEAFRKMKELIEMLPTCTAPIKGETLIMYLAASEESISVVLLAERGKNRRLQRYFQPHPIQILTDKPIKQILARPKKSGRIAKWEIKLGEHEIEFHRPNSVKGQILV